MKPMPSHPAALAPGLAGLAGTAPAAHFTIAKDLVAGGRPLTIRNGSVESQCQEVARAQPGSRSTIDWTNSGKSPGLHPGYGRRD